MEISDIFSISYSSPPVVMGFHTGSELFIDEKRRMITGKSEEYNLPENFAEVFIDKRASTDSRVVYKLLDAPSAKLTEAIQQLANKQNMTASEISGLGAKIEEWEAGGSARVKIPRKEDELIRIFIENPRTYTHSKESNYPVVYLGTKRVIACAPKID